MTFQSWRKVKRSVEDDLYSKIIRFGHTHCLRCRRPKRPDQLQCAHIIGRGSKSVRWALKPVKNAIPMCSNCHDWFDSSKDNTPIFNEKAREYFTREKNAYTFLVEECEYTWEQLALLYYKGQQPATDIKFQMPGIRKQLRDELKRLEEI